MRNTLTKPECFTDAQWAKWKANLPSINYQPNRIDWACQDCYPAFKDEMVQAGRCSWPCVEFMMMPDGTMEGRRTSISEYRGYNEGRKIIRLQKA